MHLPCHHLKLGYERTTQRLSGRPEVESYRVGTDAEIERGIGQLSFGVEPVGDPGLNAEGLTSVYVDAGAGPGWNAWVVEFVCGHVVSFLCGWLVGWWVGFIVHLCVRRRPLLQTMMHPCEMRLRCWGLALLAL